MKTLRIVSVLAFGALVGTTACDNSKLTDLNKNPNGPVDAPVTAILPNILMQSVGVQDGANGLWSTWTDLKMGAVTVQQVSEIQYPDEEKYVYRSDAVNGLWNLYSGPIEDAQTVINKGVAAKVPNWEATGRIMKAWMFGILTDYMGDVPYTEALQGGGKLTPKYDTQQSIYAADMADLVKAGAMIDPNGVGFTSGDLLFGGDMSLWKKFAYSLLLRDAIHLSNADPTTGSAMAKAAVAGGVMASNDDNAQFTYLGASPNQNPIYSNRYVSGRDDFGMGKALIDSLKSLADPRLPVYAQPAPSDGAYRGLTPGLNPSEIPTIGTISRIGAMWREDPKGPMPVMLYSEVLLLEAEAAQRGWITGSAAQFYTAAITANMEYLGVAPAAITAYLAQPRVQYNAATGLQQIGLQKWIALFMNGIEAYTENRRTDIPHIVPGIRATIAGAPATHIPTRMPYPTNEAVLNVGMLNAAVTAQGFTNASDQNKPLWFAKK
jgi:hypothetical protein